MSEYLDIQTSRQIDFWQAAQEREYTTIGESHHGPVKPHHGPVKFSPTARSATLSLLPMALGRIGPFDPTTGGRVRMIRRRDLDQLGEIALPVWTVKKKGKPDEAVPRQTWTGV